MTNLCDGRCKLSWVAKPWWNDSSATSSPPKMMWSKVKALRVYAEHFDNGYNHHDSKECPTCRCVGLRSAIMLVNLLHKLKVLK
jgi:hypothetical protein